MVACFPAATKISVPKLGHEFGHHYPWKVLFNALQEGSLSRASGLPISGLNLTSQTLEDIDLQDLLKTIPTLQ